MGTPLPLIVGFLIAVNSIISYVGFNSPQFFDRFKFDIAFRGPKNNYRYFTSAFLHVSWAHLFFNMFTLYLFGYPVVRVLGVGGFLILYFCSLLGGNLFASYYHRKSNHYAAVGASGAISGILFSTILLYPELELYLFFIPIPIPGYLFAAAYVAYSLYGMKMRNDNIGHTAHLGGALCGIILSITFKPDLLIEASRTLIYLSLTTIAVVFWLFRKKN